MHYKNIDVEIFNTQLTQLKEPNKDYKWDNLYLKANHQNIFKIIRKVKYKISILYQTY